MRKSIFVLLIFILLTAGCTQGTNTPVFEGTKTGVIPSIPVPTITKAVILSATPLLKPSPTNTEYPTSTTVSQNVLFQQCINISPSLSSEVVPPGTLVAGSTKGLSLINFSRQTQREIATSVDYFGTSPDGKWLGYNNITAKQTIIVFEKNDEKNSFQFAEGQGWYPIGRMLWLDNQRIWFPVWGPFGSVPPVMVLNPFNGQSVTIKTDYPGTAIYNYTSGGGIGLHFGNSSAVYDPSLNFVIYPELIDYQGWYQTLWNRKTQKELARVLNDGGYGNLPLWQGTQKQFLVVGYPNAEASNKEWLAVNLDGQIKQLTDFGKLDVDYIIMNRASLSPDGKTLAFSLSFQESGSKDFETSHLILLDMETLKAINTCIPSDDVVWSLDSRYLGLTTPLDKYAQNQLILVDTKENKSFQLLEGRQLFLGGWLLQP